MTPRVSHFVSWRAAALLALCGTALFPLNAQTRKAVLVGINCYNPEFPGCAKLKTAGQSNSVSRKPSISGDWRFWSYDNLEGALNDVALMKGILNNHGFETPDDAVLLDEKATADSILATLTKYLVDDASRGDFRVVYYSGHGNVVRNDASTEPDGLDQTIVPSDHWRGVADIRDKELSEIFWKAGSKGVHVVFIADSCHSASLTRDMADRAKTSRDAARKSPQDNGAPRVSDAANREHDPLSVGVVEIAAARRDQSALETEGRSENLSDPTSGTHGAFTWALKLALEKAPYATIDEVFARTASFLNLDKPQQTPVLEGNDRAHRGIFGEPAEEIRALRAIVDQVDSASGEITIRAGRAVGIYAGAQLKRVSSTGEHMTITVTSADLAFSKAIVTSQSAKPPVRVADAFEVEKWVVPARAMLSVFVPPSASADIISRTAREIGKLATAANIEWIGDESLVRPTHLMSWNGQSWRLEELPARPKQIVPQAIDLGVEPTAANVLKKLPERAKFLFVVPPSSEFAAALSFDAKRIVRTKTAAGANYILEGRINVEGRIDDAATEYAWVRVDSVKTETAKVNPMPVRTDWVANGHEAEPTKARAVEDLAYRLGRLREWHLLEAPGPEKIIFPYRLAFRDEQGKFNTSGQVYDGEKYKIYLQADRATLDALKGRVSPHWVYVFVMDESGRSRLLHPFLGRGNQDNFLPAPNVSGTTTPASDLIPISNEPSDLIVGRPWGTDTYFLLVSEQPVDNPDVFEFDGVRADAPADRDVGANPLDRLLAEVGTMSRRSTSPVPSTWSIRKLYITSFPPKTSLPAKTSLPPKK